MSIPPVSERLEAVPASPIRKLVPYALAAKKEGVLVYHLNIGDPDIETPACMIDVLKTWKTTPIRYELSQGNPKLIDALVWYYRRLGHTCIDRKHIQVTTGGSEAIAMALFSVANPGDEVIVFEPYYANYGSIAIQHGVRLIPIQTRLEDGFHLPNRRTIENSITKKTKAILICTPNNPTGTVYTEDEMAMLVSIAKKHNLFLLSDEVYREFCYGKTDHVSLLSFMEDIPNHAILVDSLSKRYALCGARVGCLVSMNTAIMEGVLRIAQGRLSSGLVDQVMASTLTDVPLSYTNTVRKEYQKRRDALFAKLATIPGMKLPPKPEGAFYAIIGLPVADAEDFCTFLLTTFRDKNETVMLAPASGFYGTPNMGTNEVRIAYVLNGDAIKRSVEIIRKALKSYHT